MLEPQKLAVLFYAKTLIIRYHLTVLAEIHVDPMFFFGSSPGFVYRGQSDPDFVNPIGSSPGFVNPVRSDQIPSHLPILVLLTPLAGRAPLFRYVNEISCRCRSVVFEIHPARTSLKMREE